jgi:hypothetical protein
VSDIDWEVVAKAQMSSVGIYFKILEDKLEKFEKSKKGSHLTPHYEYLRGIVDGTRSAMDEAKSMLISEIPRDL